MTGSTLYPVPVCDHCRRATGPRQHRTFCSGIVHVRPSDQEQLGVMPCLCHLNGHRHMDQPTPDPEGTTYLIVARGFSARSPFGPRPVAQVTDSWTFAVQAKDWWRHSAKHTLGNMGLHYEISTTDLVVQLRRRVPVLN